MTSPYGTVARVTPREAKLIVALEANAALRAQAEELIAAYVAPESRLTGIS
jgi:hypothetical protein